MCTGTLARRVGQHSENHKHEMSLFRVAEENKTQLNSMRWRKKRAGVQTYVIGDVSFANLLNGVI